VSYNSLVTLTSEGTSIKLIEQDQQIENVRIYPIQIYPLTMNIIVSQRECILELVPKTMND